MTDALVDKARTAGLVWFGRVLSGLVIAFMVFDGAIKLPPLDVVTQTMTEMGWPADPATARLLGVIGLISTMLYAFPRTALLGAVLLTGYFGGAIATHVRISSPLFSHELFGVYLGVMMWAGLWLRSPRLRAIFPVTRETGGP
jgi:hypothetical protein